MTSLGYTRRARRGRINRWGSKPLRPPQPHSMWQLALRVPRRAARRLLRLIEDARGGPRTRSALSRWRELGGLAERAASSRLRVPTAVLMWVALAMVASNLTLVALRSDITRTRYDLSQGVGELQQLDEQSRALTLQLRQLHDPRRLNEIARARGFGPPERIVVLP